jgi:hypothetical protein
MERDALRLVGHKPTKHAPASFNLPRRGFANILVRHEQPLPVSTDCKFLRVGAHREFSPHLARRCVDDRDSVCRSVRLLVFRAFGIGAGSEPRRSAHGNIQRLPVGRKMDAPWPLAHRPPRLHRARGPLDHTHIAGALVAHVEAIRRGALGATKASQQDRADCQRTFSK